jgi:hypothetical protein
VKWKERRNHPIMISKQQLKDYESVVNVFETWCWRRMLKIKWTVRTTNDEVFQRAKEKRLLLKIYKK